MTAVNENCYEFRGGTADVKPLGINVENSNVSYTISEGSTFFDMETGTVYMLRITLNADGTKHGQWIEI